MMNLIRAALCGLLIYAASPALGQVSKSALSSQTTQSFPDNSTGAITPAVIRTYMGSVINSFQQYAAVNPQAGTTYTIAITDYGQLITFNNAAAVAVTLPQATGSFATFNTYVQNVGAGTVTITPTTSTIGGAATLVLTTSQSSWIISDGTNYQTWFSPATPINCAGLPAFTGDTTKPSASCATTTVQVNGVAYGTSPSTNTVPVVTGSNAVTYEIVPLLAGGTNAGLTASNGGIVYSTASAMAILAGTANASRPLLSGSSTTPGWAAVAYPTSATSGGIPYFSSTTVMATSALLAANQLVVGGGAGTAPATLGSLGTTTTVLHGNAGGAPSYAAVSLTADVSNVLPFANGGTNDSGTAATTYTPTLACVGGGTLTTSSASGRYKQLAAKYYEISINVTLTTVGTCVGPVTATLPSVTAASAYVLSGRENFSTGKSVIGKILAADTTVSLAFYDNTTVVVNGYNPVVSGVFEVQ